MNLKEFFDYKNQFVEDILTSESIVKLINENVSVEDAESLMYTQVFPLEYIPDTVEDAKTYVCVDVDVIGSSDPSRKTFLSPVIYVWVMTHRSLMRLPDGGVRVDKLCAEICDKMNGSRKYGLGELNLYAAKRFAPMTDYNGRVLSFYTRDFSRVYDGTKPIPSNRKVGV